MEDKFDFSIKLFEDDDYSEKQIGFNSPVPTKSKPLNNKITAINNLNNSVNNTATKNQSIIKNSLQVSKSKSSLYKTPLASKSKSNFLPLLSTQNPIIDLNVNGNSGKKENTLTKSSANSKSILSHIENASSPIKLTVLNKAANKVII